MYKRSSPLVEEALVGLGSGTEHEHPRRSGLWSLQEEGRHGQEAEEETLLAEGCLPYSATLANNK